MNKNFILATATLIGTIVGAGVFGLPYIMVKSGALLCFFYFLFLGLIVLLLHLFMGEIVLRTKDRHRLIGYSKKYLGKIPQFFAAFSTIVGTIGALLAYIILGGKFLGVVFSSALSEVHFALILWLILSVFVFWGIRSISRLEVLFNMGFVLLVFLIFFFCLPKVETSNFILADTRYAFLPFGVILFSLLGWNAVPEVSSILKNKAHLKKVIYWAIAAAVVFYFLFALVVSGVSGPLTSQEAFEGLASFLGKKIIVLGGLFGVFSIASSFLVLSNYLKNSLRFDLNLPYLPSFFLTCFVPLFLYLSGFRGFIGTIAAVGTLMGAIEGLLIVAIYKKSKNAGDRKPEYSLKVPKFFLFFVPLIFVLGLLFQILACTIF